MKNSGGFAEKFKKKPETVKQEAPVNAEPQEGENKVWKVMKTIGRVLFHLRKVVMAIPVVYYALQLAAYNQAHLPELVGLNLQSTGEYAQMIARETAVMGPLVVTGACLVLMFCSRKSIYPWIISIFSLALPILLLVTNIYPC